MKKIALSVVGIHVFLLLWMALWSPVKPVEKKPLKVHTMVVKAPPPPSPVITATPVSTPAPVIQPVVKKAPPVKKQPAPSSVPKKPAATVQKKATPIVPQNLVNQLKESIAKIDEKPQKVFTNKPLTAPKSITTLKVDECTQEIEDGYVGALVECLQSALDLPEVGEVKLELTLTSDGRFVRTKVMKSGSERNRSFLENSLKEICFPSFTGQLKQEKEHTFVLTFFNS